MDIVMTILFTYATGHVLL